MGGPGVGLTVPKPSRSDPPPPRGARRTELSVTPSGGQVDRGRTQARAPPGHQPPSPPPGAHTEPSTGGKTQGVPQSPRHMGSTPHQVAGAQEGPQLSPQRQMPQGQGQATAKHHTRRPPTREVPDLQSPSAANLQGLPKGGRIPAWAAFPLPAWGPASL